jgi:hypothetical protein
VDRAGWANLINSDSGSTAEQLKFVRLPALGRVTVSSPAVMRPLIRLNEGKPYADQIKPFNFLLTSQVRPLGHPVGTDPEHFHLISPYESDSRRWLNMDWIDQYSGSIYRIVTDDYHGSRDSARVKTYEDVIAEYKFHSEAKCADALGKPCGKQTIGLLQRRHIQIAEIKAIGKESNSIEEVESGLIQSAENVYTEYVDPKRDEWTTKILPALKNARRDVLLKMTPLSRTEITDIRAGRAKPHPKNQQLLVDALRKLGLL